MKLIKIVLLPLVAMVTVFFVLFLFYYYQLIPKLIFEIATGENVKLVILGDYSGVYVLGVILLSILCGWKVAQRFSPKIKNYVVAFKAKISQKLLLFISVISILISFNQIYFFTIDTIYKTSIIPFTGITKLKYHDIESVIVFADFRKDEFNYKKRRCQLYTNITILSKYFTIEQKFLTYAETFDIGSILRQQGIVPVVNYSNVCNFIPEYRRGVIENSFDVKL